MKWLDGQRKMGDTYEKSQLDSEISFPPPHERQFSKNSDSDSTSSGIFIPLKSKIEKVNIRCEFGTEREAIKINEIMYNAVQN